MEWKSNLFQLFLLAYLNFQFGTIMSVIGTTLPDLRCIYHVGLDDVSSLFLSIGLATTTSNIFFTILMKTCNFYLVMATLMLIFSVGLAMFAVTPFIAIAHVMAIFIGSSIGVMLPGSYLQCNLLFPDKTFPFHVLSSAVAAGSCLIPIIAEPFLGKYNGNLTATIPYNTSTGSSLPLWATRVNLNFSNSSDLSTNSRSHCDSSSSTVNYVYVILGSSGLPLAVAFCLLYVKSNSGVQSESDINDGYTDLSTTTSRYKIAFCVLLVLTFAPGCGTSYAYGSYLTTKGAEGPLGLQVSALLTSLFWLFFLIGRITSTAATHCISQIIILYICFLGQIASVVLLLVTNNSEIFIWIGSLSFGFFSGPIFASLMAWGRQYTSLTPLVCGMCTLSDMLGTAVLPYIAGLFINWYGMEIHNYYCLILSLLQLVIFFVLHGIGVWIRSDKK